MAKVVDEHRRDRASGRPVKVYVVRWKEPDGRQREKTFRLKREANAFAAAVESEKAQGSYRDPNGGRITIAVFLRDHLNRMQVSAGTMEKYLVIAEKHVIPVLGNYQLDALRRSHIQAWAKGLADSGLSASTANHAFKVLAGWLNVAVGDRLIAENPCARVVLPRPVKKQVVPLRPDQVGAIIRETPERYRAMVLLVAASGMRQAEVFGITRSRIDFLRRQVRVDRQVVSGTGRPPALVDVTKTAASVRVIPLPQEALDALAAHLAAFPVDDDDAPIFTSDTGKLLRRSNVNQMWKATLRRAGVADSREHGFHAFRHYYASSLIAAGLNAKVVQVRLGHASITETFDTYGHLFPEAEEQTRAAASAALAGVPLEQADLRLTAGAQP
jgi:integrase